LTATRLFHYTATVLLEGTFVFWSLIAWPAFRQTNAAQALQTSLDRRLIKVAWASLAVALLSGVAWLVIVASNMSSMPLNAVVRAGVVNVVLTQTRFGEAWMLRAALVIVIAGSLVVQARTRNRTAGWMGLLAASAFIASLAWAGHGAATEDVPFDAFHLPADILHLLAAGAWLGALLPLVMLLRLAWRERSDAALAVARAATLRFSILGIASVALLLVTGVINTIFLAGSIPALLGTLYGQLLLVKVALFAAMIAAASVNQRRLLPRLADAITEAGIRWGSVAQVGRNASVEAGLGVFVLAVVAIIGILTPGLHTEPNWPLPFRFDLSEGFVRAYPTSFYASTQPYAAPSIALGAPLYAQNCTACHGVQGRGDGLLAAKLPVRPADLTEPHLFAHKPGELYWWVSYGSDNGVMPGFAKTLSPDQRWDVINFVLARTAGLLARSAGSRISTTIAVPVPDFAFESNGAQNTLLQTLKNGPVLLVLFGTHAPRARLEQLESSEERLASVGLRIVAVGLGPSTDRARMAVGVSQDVRVALALFRSPSDGGETELMLDRGANVRARWTASGTSGLAGMDTLLADTTRVASIPVAAANHAGHAH
jgi:copper resistance protein D